MSPNNIIQCHLPHNVQGLMRQAVMENHRSTLLHHSYLLCFGFIGKGKRQRQKFAIRWFTPQMLVTAKSGQVEVRI